MPQLRDGIEDDLATVILNNPPQNRLSVEMLDELAQGLDTIGQSAARALLLRADGPDFSFGNQGVKSRKAATGHRFQRPVPRPSLVIAPA
jgi:enoyl-CoA hydratase/carnithine racemase